MGDSEKKLDLSIVKENRLIRFAVITLSVYLFFRFIFPLTAPFFFAFILITLFYPLLQRIQKKIPMRKKFLAFGVLFLVLLFLAAILWALGYSGGGQLDKVSVFMEMAYESLQGSSSYSCFKAIFEAVAFLFISFLAAILLEKDYALFLTWLKGSEDMTFIFKALEGILEYIITFLKAQGVILLIISVFSSAVLWATGIYGGGLWGILAGCLDVLPFIGTGVVLVPMAIWQFLTGKYIQMGVCIALYIACIFIREFLEPKLIGNKMGIAPVLMLLGIYAGIRLFGVIGIIEGPLALIVIHELMKV